MTGKRGWELRLLIEGGQRGLSEKETFELKCVCQREMALQRLAGGGGGVFLSRQDSRDKGLMEGMSMDI